MVAEPRTWVDVDGALREWARDHVAGVGRRVFFGANVKAAYPYLVVSRIGGPDDRVLVQVDAWGSTQAQAAAAARELCDAADGLSRYRHNGALLHGARVESVRWQPDDESATPRYIVDLTVSATADAA